MPSSDLHGVYMYVGKILTHIKTKNKSKKYPQNLVITSSDKNNSLFIPKLKNIKSLLTHTHTHTTLLNPPTKPQTSCPYNCDCSFTHLFYYLLNGMMPPASFLAHSEDMLVNNVQLSPEADSQAWIS